MKTPNGSLEILREYTCGCIVYRDAHGVEFEELGLFCDVGPECSKALVQGEETQTSLF